MGGLTIRNYAILAVAGVVLLFLLISSDAIISLDSNGEFGKHSQCNDKVDNDKDGKIDLNDPGCKNKGDKSELGINQCDNGINDDYDKLIDYPRDPGCASITDTKEINSNIQCDNGIDDDKDGLIDYPKDIGCKDSLDNNEINEISADSCIPLFDTNNDPSKDRINLVLIGSDFSSIEQFKTVAKSIIALDGSPKYMLGKSGETVTIRWGLFSIEPIKSSANKFNIWYFSRQANSSQDIEQLKTRIESICNLKYVSPAFIYRKVPNEYSHGLASRPSFNNATITVKENTTFGYSQSSFEVDESSNDTIQDYRLFVRDSGRKRKR